ncbi:MAG: AI-2E family transporter YdiK [Hydrogenophaga sp.]|uniref:AI-2E family transporter YdiK n=1 Tax=Hydrogenophaga sp. TaxID=1904254 RepID=UPI002730CE95|nr:AI-2E family transporter YdiK [Hydrogenophaga sp.]MDP2164686.1 AI-2E family transporter YdiK [Hydrogenophaga sp.]
MTHTPRDLTRTVLAVLAIGMLIAASFWIVRPFLPAFIWATMIVVASWPLMLRVEARLWGSRALAVTVMTLALLIVLIVPLALAVVTIVNNAEEMIGWVKALKTVTIPPPPDWVGALPVIGEKAAEAWQKLATAGVADLTQKATPYAGRAIRWFAEQVGSAGVIFVEFLLMVVIAAIMFATGEHAATGVRSFGRRLAGARGEDVVNLAAQAIRGVALGVIVTALVQAVLGGVGLAVAGVPFATVFTAIMLLLAIAQIGVVPVLAPAVGWLYWSGEVGLAIALLIWTVFVATLDNFLRPLLIKRGAADLPLLLIFAGVIGGLIAFGLAGIFIGPVVLAVSFMLLDAWVSDAHPADESK